MRGRGEREGGNEQSEIKRKERRKNGETHRDPLSGVLMSSACTAGHKKHFVRLWQDNPTEANFSSIYFGKTSYPTNVKELKLL